MRVQDSIVLSIAEGLRLRLSGEERARLGGIGTDNPEAYELFLKGRFLMQRETEEDDLEALRLFKLAEEKDRSFSTRTWRSRAPTAGCVGGGLQSSRERGSTPMRPSQRPSRSIRTTSPCVWRWRTSDSSRSTTGRPPSARSRCDGRSRRPPYHSCGTRSPSSSWPSGGPTRPRRWSSARSSSIPATSNRG